MIKKINLQPVFVREKVIKICRSYFEDQQFHEVMAPVLNNAIPLEETLYPFSTEWNALKAKKSLFLSISPESSLKKMLAAEIGNCYSIAKCFRNLEESGEIHNPEFLMLEWYRVNATMEDIMHEVKLLVEYIFDRIFPDKTRNDKKEFSYQGNSINISEWQTISLKDSFKFFLNVDLIEVIEMQAMIELAQKKGYTTEDSSWEQLFDQIYLNEIEPFLPKQPYFLTDYPLRLSPLCAAKKGEPHIAQRFEFFIHGMEIGNGNKESTNAVEVLESFKNVSLKRQITNTSSPIDQDFIEALVALNGRELAGIGIGVDRLAMLFADVPEIKMVEPFSLSL